MIRQIDAIKWSCVVFSLVSLSSCFSSTLYYEVPPSEKALIRTSAFVVERFAGNHAALFQNILIQEIYRIPNFNYLAETPKNDSDHVALITGEVELYSVRDEIEKRPEVKINLVTRNIMLQKQGSSDRIPKRAYEFVEIPFQERIIHRTIDLEISFMVKAVENEQLLYQNREVISYQQSYIGEEEIRLLPESSSEMERLGRELIQRFLDKLNPVQKRRVRKLEKGTAPIPWTVNILDIGHPGILQANRYAVSLNYDQAIKGWNYVVFEPISFKSSEKFIFTNEVYTRLREAKLPRNTMKKLLSLYRKSFELSEIDSILLALMKRPDFQLYGSVIKYHSRSSKSFDGKNLSAAHYNLGVVYQLKNDLQLAAYHFAQANAYNPQEKYAQAWTDVQHEMGDYNPLDTLIERTIEAAGKRRPPEKAMVQPRSSRTTLILETLARPVEEVEIKPVELPLLEEISERQQIQDAQAEELPNLQLN